MSKSVQSRDAIETEGSEDARLTEGSEYVRVSEGSEDVHAIETEGTEDERETEGQERCVSCSSTIPCDHLKKWCLTDIRFFNSPLS